MPNRSSADVFISMKIGILSDTHGNLPRTIRATELLLARGVGALLHCGDIGSEEVLDEISARAAAHGIPLHAVLGNVDEYEAVIWRGADGRPLDTQKELILAGKRIAILHGHHFSALERAIASGDFDYIFTGHTHQARDERIGCTRVINPGAVHRAHPPSIAVLDLATDDLHTIAI